MEEIREYIAECQASAFPDAAHPPPLIISKIESTEALDNLDEIIAVSDGIMVARGDLGVEIPVEEVTIWQKIMVAKCNMLGKPVVVATQMLETMQKNPRPTRAEVSDVTNALIDGADAVMLSGESANGNYPIESVRTMQTIIQRTEEWIKEPSLVNSTGHKVEQTTLLALEAAAEGIITSATSLDAKCIIVSTAAGSKARLVAKHRPNVPVVAICTVPKVARQLNIHRGVQPYVGPEIRGLAARTEAAKMAADWGFCDSGDYVVVMDMGGASNVIQVP